MGSVIVDEFFLGHLKKANSSLKARKNMKMLQ